MAAEKDKAIDYSKIAEALHKLAETPNPKSKTLADHLREPSVKEAIERAKDAGYRSDAIVPLLLELGIKTTTASFDATWSKLRREERGDSGVKSGAKAKTNTKRNEAPKPAEKSPETKTETASKPAAKPADNGGGKPLTKDPSMGGAFNSDEL